MCKLTMSAAYRAAYAGRTRNMKLSATRYVLVQQIVNVRRDLRHTAAHVRQVSTAV